MSRKQTILIAILMALLAITGVTMIVIALLIRSPTQQVISTISFPTATRVLVPTATSTATSTPAFTLAVTSPPTEIPSPAPAPRFGPIRFGTGVQGEQSPNPSTIFPPGVKEVYAVWSYQGMANGTPYRVSWFLDGNLWSDKTLTWDANRLGSEGTAFVTPGQYGEEGLPPGNYRLELFISDQRVQAATFVVLAPTPTPTPPPPTPQPDMRTIGRQAALSVVQIWVSNGYEFVKGGSGTIIDGQQGLIATNWHILVDGAGDLLNEGGYAMIGLTTDPDKMPVYIYWAQVLPEYSSPDVDLAILQITHRIVGQTYTSVSPPLDLSAIRLGDSASVRRGDHVLLLGFPDYAEGTLSWTEGTVTTLDDWWIKSDAQISHGHSGGMMLNELGKLVGILTQVEQTTAGGVLALARPINLIRSGIASAITGGFVSPPTAPSSSQVAAGERMMVIGARTLNLRYGPSLNSQVVGEMRQGTVVEVREEPSWDGERFWYYVQVQGTTQAGWASGFYLAPWEIARSPILFTSNRAGNQDIYRVFPDGTGLWQITNDPGDEGDPSWSPNRDYIVFTSNRNGNSDLYIMTADGGPWMQLTSGAADDIHPVWSPDNSRIAFVSKWDGDWELFVVNVDGTGLQQVTFNNAWDSFPSWAPDSRHLVFTSQRTGNYDLFLVNLQTGDETQLTTSPYSDAHPSWAPQGDEIVYTMVVPEENTLLREIGFLNMYDLAHPRRLRVNEPEGVGCRYPDWSPDARWIVFTSDRDGDEEIYLISARGGDIVNLSSSPASNDTAPAWAR